MATNLIFDSSKFNNVFDTLSSKIKSELDIQYEKKRILGSEYADTYAKLMDRVLQLAYQDQLEQKKLSITTDKTNAEVSLLGTEQQVKLKDIDLRQAEIDLKQADIDLRAAEINLKEGQLSELELNGTADRSLKGSQKLLYDRQTSGFDENRDQKLFEAQCNAFSLMMSSGMLAENATVPAALGSDAMNAVYQSISGVDPSTL